MAEEVNKGCTVTQTCGPNNLFDGALAPDLLNVNTCELSSPSTPGVIGKVSTSRHYFFIRHEIIEYLIYLNEISIFVKMSEVA